MLTAKDRSIPPERRLPLRTESHRSGTSARVYDLLLDQIINFERLPYEEVSETSLAEDLGVSRTPVREALARLAKLKLVDIFPQRGSMIAPIRLSDLKKAQFLRESLEIGLVRRAMKAPTIDDLVDALEHEVQVQRALAAAGDEARFCQSDEFFHRLIARAAGLPEIWDDIYQAKLHIDRVGRLMLAWSTTMPAVADQHAEIVGAMRTGCIDTVDAKLKAHLRRIFGFLKAAQKANPAYFVESEWDVVDPSWFDD